ncbi:hypothetical protein [Streptomyces sp. NPDC048473]
MTAAAGRSEWLGVTGLAVRLHTVLQEWDEQHGIADTQQTTA